MMGLIDGCWKDGPWRQWDGSGCVAGEKLQWDAATVALGMRSACLCGVDRPLPGLCTLPYVCYFAPSTRLTLCMCALCDSPRRGLWCCGSTV